MKIVYDSLFTTEKHKKNTKKHILLHINFVQKTLDCPCWVVDTRHIGVTSQK
jgi:hypothetical protein